MKFDHLNVGGYDATGVFYGGVRDDHHPGLPEASVLVEGTDGGKHHFTFPAPDAADPYRGFCPVRPVIEES